MNNKSKNELKGLEWRAEKYSLGRAMTAALSNGTTLKVLDIEPHQAGAVGYTSRNKTIHLAYDHEIMNGLDEKHKRAFRMGVCTHELMHQILTDFVILEKNVIGLPSYEQQIMCHIDNILEDARIEHYAYQFVGGNLLASLEFAIAHTYKITPVLEESQSPLAQYLNALIMFGDMGPLKGRFTFPEAKEVFKKTSDLFLKGIHETSPRKKMKIVKDIFELSRPLWEDEADMAKLMEELSKEMAKHGKSSSHGSGKPSSTATDDSDEEDDKKSKRRKMTRKEFEEALKNGEVSKGGKGEQVEIEDAKTADEAEEAASDAKASAQAAREAANEANKSAEKTQSDGSSPARQASAQAAAKRAEAAAEKAEAAAEKSAQAAQAARNAANSGDADGEANASKEAGKEAMKAANAAKNAENAASAAAGESSGSASQDADGAAESAAQASDSAAEAAENAKSASEAEAKEGEGEEGNSSGMGKSAAQKAAEAAQKAAEAAAEAKSAAEAAAEAAENKDAESEAANARAAARAAAKAKSAARAAERAAAKARGEKTESDEYAAESEYEEYQDGDVDNTETEYSDRCMNGVTPDYSNASSGLSEEDDGTVTEFDEEDYELSEEDLDAIEKEVESCMRDIEREMLDEEGEKRTPLPDFDIAISRVKQASTCLNVRVQPGDDMLRLAESYARIYVKLKSGITSLTGQLRRIFQADVEEKVYRYSGKVNMKRLNAGRKTARVFDRRRLPAEKADVVVELLIDESGSMSGSKAEHAKQTAVALAEVMGNLKIPVYVIGFTADTSGYDAVHNHYITWKNTKADRFKLLNITARANNFDGYSIRYAGEILKKKNAKHKLLIVISDGSPACSAYRGTDGIADNKDAIRDVRKNASVLGVAIGNSDTEELHYMYGQDFIHIRNMDDLFAGISSKMASIIQSWE